MSDADDREAELVAAAWAARDGAVCTYSGFAVGAALEDDQGRMWTGANVENASYTLGLCAERVAVFKAVSEGFRDFEAIAVVAESDRPTAPCGPCRQILWEFCGDIWVHIARPGRKAKSYRMSELLPVPFDDRHL